MFDDLINTQPRGFLGLGLSRVGLGTWALGGDRWAYGWGHQEDNDSLATIRRALECGVNWIDTAGVYGLGRSETIVAEAVRAIRREDRPLIFTKCGFGWNTDAPLEAPERIGRAETLVKQVDESLKRLQVDRIDLCFMHWPPRDGTPIDEYWATLLALKREGKLARIGLSNHDLPELKVAHAIGHVDCVQVPFSVLRQGLTAEGLAWCRTQGIGVVAYSPMQSGLLSGAFDAQRVRSLSSTDWRSQASQFKGAALAQGLELVEVLRTVARRRGASVAAVAVSWALEQPGVSGAIVGARRPSQVDSWQEALTLRLADSDVREIREGMTRLGLNTD